FLRRATQGEAEVDPHQRPSRWLKIPVLAIFMTMAYHEEYGYARTTCLLLFCLTQTSLSKIFFIFLFFDYFSFRCRRRRFAFVFAVLFSFLKLSVCPIRPRPRTCRRSLGKIRNREDSTRWIRKRDEEGDKKVRAGRKGRIAVRLSASKFRQGVLIVNIAWRIRYFGGRDRELWRPVCQTEHRNGGRSNSGSEAHPPPVQRQQQTSDAGPTLSRGTEARSCYHRHRLKTNGSYRPGAS
ncbi:hypothetical protein V1478_002492, partial [Vespula squamosa]